MAVSGQHVVGVLRDASKLQDVLQGQEETLAKLHAVLDDAAENKKVWANLSSRMFSCQVTFGSALTSSLALKLNLPLDAFEPIGPSAATNAEIEEQKQQLQIAKQELAQLRRQDKQAGQSLAEQQQALLQAVPQDALAAAAAAVAGGDTAAEPAGSSSRQRGSSSSSNGSGSSSSSDDEAAAALKSLQGRDPVVVAKRLAKRARKMMAEADQGQNVTTWNSFMVSCLCYFFGSLCGFRLGCKSSHMRLMMSALNLVCFKHHSFRLNVSTFRCTSVTFHRMRWACWLSSAPWTSPAYGCCHQASSRRNAFETSLSVCCQTMSNNCSACYMQCTFNAFHRMCLASWLSLALWRSPACASSP
jgi:hypothetical protein